MNENEAIIEAQRIAMWGTLLAALIGGLIGFLGSWLATFLNTKAERRRMLLQLGCEMGIKQWDTLFGHLSKMTESGRKGNIAPPILFVNTNVRALELLSEGKLTSENLEKLFIELEDIKETITKHSDTKK
jgi:hypothetical protein